MSATRKKPLLSSLAKKYLMAISGFVFVAYVLVHMAGNLQIFGPPRWINYYAYFLHDELPPVVLWGFRLVLLLALVVHVWMAVLLTKENKSARKAYGVKKPVQSTFTQRTMPVTGLILLAFIIFHILHFTVRVVPENYHEILAPTTLEPHGHLVDGEQVQIATFDVYSMIIEGFSNVWVAGFYLIAMGLLCMHLSHGVSSMFQSIGVRNERWRYHLHGLSVAYGWVIFIGFASVPAAVLLHVFAGVPIFDQAYLDAQATLPAPDVHTALPH